MKIKKTAGFKGQRGQSFIGILIVLIIAVLLYFTVAKKYLASPVSRDKDAQKALAGEGINPSNLSDTVKKAQEAADKANNVNRQLETAPTPPAE